MPYICCVPGCGRTGKKIFHSFPKDKVRCQRWIYKTKCFQLNKETAYKTHNKVCHAHFRPEDYTSTMRRFLKSDVVPSLHLPELENACLRDKSRSHKDFCLSREVIPIDFYNGITLPLPEILMGNVENVVRSENQEAAASSAIDNTNTSLNNTYTLEEAQVPDIVKNVVIQPLKDDNEFVMYFDSDNQTAAKRVWIEDYSVNEQQSDSVSFRNQHNEISINSENHAAADPKTNTYLLGAVQNPAAVKNFTIQPLNDDNEVMNFNSDNETADQRVWIEDCLPDEQENDLASYLKEHSEMNINFENHTAADPSNDTDVLNDVLNDVLIPAVTCENVKASIHSSKSKYKTTTNVRPSTTYNPAARKARYQDTRIKFLAKKFRNCEKLQNSTIFKYLESKLNANQMTFIKMQIMNAGKKARGNRFSFEEKCMAFAIYKQSPKCYRFQSKLFTLPCKQTLNNHSAHIRFEAGINPKLMEYISGVAKEMNQIDKPVTIGWDEMALATHLDYCKVKDYIDGFVDDGNKRTNEFATHALVFMVRGINKSFKQPIAYFLTQNINKDELAELIRLVITAVLKTGLKIVGSVCDAVSTNLSAVRKLINPDYWRQRFSGEILEYKIQDTSIIHFFDPPHLIKSIRNNMLSKDLHHFVTQSKYSSASRKTDKIYWDSRNKKERVASWDDVKEFYEYNEKGMVELLTKITNEHIEPKKKKMRVSVAVQVFSRTLGTTMYYCSEHKQLSRDFTGTADILLFFNEVFDSLNGGGLPSVKDSLLGSINQHSYHFTFWKYAVEMLRKMRYVPKNPETQEKSRVLKDFILTINGLSELTKRLLNLNVESVSIRTMTQDALENFFGGIRCYCQAAVKPTARNFRCAYATSLFNNLSSDHSIKSNCEDDGGIPLLQNLFSMFVSKEITNDPAINSEELSELDDSNVECGFLDRHQSTPVNEVGNYVAAHVCKAILSKNHCTNCEKSILTRAKTDNYHGLIARSQSSTIENKLLTYPKPKFVDSFKKLASRLEQSVTIYCFQKSLSEKVLQGAGVIEDFAGCDLHKTELSQKFTVTTTDFLISAFTNKVNNLLSGKVTIFDPSDNIQKAAFEFNQKKKHIGKYNDINKQ